MFLNILSIMKCHLKWVIFVSTVAFIAAVSSSRPSKVTQERVIDDVEALLWKGVPIDYSYNETVVDLADDRTSVPGCPKSINGTPWAYHGTPPRCYFTGGVGPCEDRLVFISQRGSFYGICQCVCLVDPDFDKTDIVETERYIQCKSDNPKYPSTQVYDKKKQQCYGLLQRGPCNDTYLFVGLKNDSPSCLPKCEKLGLDIPTFDASGISVPNRIHAYLPAVLPKGECEEGKKWSSKLEKCVDTNPDNFEDSGVFG